MKAAWLFLLFVLRVRCLDDGDADDGDADAAIDDEARSVFLAILRPKPDGQNNFNSNMGGGALIAIKNINEHMPLDGGYKIEPIWYMPGCNDSESLNQVVNASSMTIHGFIGPECSKSVESIALLARGWNIAMISYGASTPTVSDHQRYSTFARSIAPYNMMGNALAELMIKFNWNKHICILTSVEDIWLRTAEEFKTSLEERNIQDISIQYIFPSNINDIHDTTSETDFDHRIKEILRSLETIARIVVLLTYDDTKVLSYASDLGMLNGEYAFIVVESVDSHLHLGLEKMGVPDDKFSEVLTGLFSITYNPPDLTTQAYQTFIKNLSDVVGELPYDPITDGMGPSDEPEEIVYEAFMHDAVMLFAKGLNDTMKDDSISTGLFSVGKSIRDHINGSVFEGLSGTLNMSNGDRQSDFLIENYQGTRFVDVFLHLQANNSLTPHNAWMFHGGVVRPPDPCGASNELCEEPGKRDKEIIIALTSTFAAILVLIVAALLVWRVHNRRKMMRRLWEIKLNDIIFFNESTKMAYGQAVSTMSMVSTFTSDHPGGYCFSTNKAVIKNKSVYLKRTQKQHVTINDKILKECQQLLEARNPNVVEFVGVCLAPENIFIATAFCSKRSLQDIVSDERVKLDMMFKMALAADLVKGLSYIHQSPIVYHGNLNSSNCLVDDHWTLKLTDFGIRYLRRTLGDNTLKSGKALMEAELWRAPEFIHTPKYTGSNVGDVYGVGIILQEIICEDCPYPGCVYSTEEILEKVPFGFRPKITHEHATTSFIEVVERCWDHTPANRISLQEIRKTLYELNPDRRISLTDRMMKLMNKYTDQLETLVEERTVQLKEEKRRADQLLYSMLPKQVAEKLKMGEPVSAEAFDCASIYFSDIVGFTDLSRRSTPFQVVDLLNDLYTLFDELVDKFDCYKVETIGDAYMVVSGIPQRNGHNHSYEIAALSLQLLLSMNTFTVRHDPSHKLNLRIGLHSGACAAGVVGLKMPRYCLFGDTVNTASRMESTGLPSRIHTSKDFYDELQRFRPEFVLEARGEMEIKGKGVMETYFLLGRRNTSPLSDDTPVSPGASPTQQPLSPPALLLPSTSSAPQHFFGSPALLLPRTLAPLTEARSLPSLLPGLERTVQHPISEARSTPAPTLMLTRADNVPLTHVDIDG